MKRRKAPRADVQPMVKYFWYLGSVAYELGEEGQSFRLAAGYHSRATHSYCCRPAGISGACPVSAMVTAEIKMWRRRGKVGPETEQTKRSSGQTKTHRSTMTLDGASEG